MSKKQAITEEDQKHLEWYEEARGMTLEKLPEFLRKLSEDYSHDYGTCVHMIAASAIAAAWAMNNTPSGNITGFQASCVMWEFIQRWGGYERKPLRLLDYSNMLYPQYDHHFDKTISKETWKWLQEKAKENYDERGDGTHPNVVMHWVSIIENKIPFGFSVKEEA